MKSDFQYDYRRYLEFDLSFNDFYEDFCEKYGDLCHCFVLKDEFGDKIKEDDQEDIKYVSIKKNLRYNQKENSARSIKILQDMFPIEDRISRKQEQIFEINKIPIPNFEIQPEFNGRKFYYTISFEWEITEDCINVKLTSRKDMEKQLEQKFGKKVHIYLLFLLGEYFTAVCKQRDRYLEANISVGWTGYEGHRYYQDILEKVYDKDERIIFRLKKEEGYKVPEDTMLKILSCLALYPQYIFIFAYGLLSVSLNGKRDYVEQNKELSEERKSNEIYQIKPFNLCICGVNPGLTKKDIAMTFLGYCKVSEKNYRKNYTKIPYMSSKKVEENIFKLCLYKDCPIIIYPSGNTSDISASSTAVTRIDRWRKKNIIKGFPVFISKRKMVNDNVINIDVTDAHDIKMSIYNNIVGQQEKVSYTDIAVCVDTLVCNFIVYLENIYSKELYKKKCEYEDKKIANNQERIKQYFLTKKIVNDRERIKQCFLTYSKIFSDSRYNLEMACAYRDLLTALSQFSLFVDYICDRDAYTNKKLCKELMKEIIKQAEEIAKEEALDCEIKERRKPVKKEKTKVNKDAIREKFFDTVLKELERESAYIDESEEFLYIDYKEFQKCYEGDNYKQFLAICRDIHLIEVPKRASNGKFRGYAFDKMKDGKKYKVLKVYKKFYRDYCKAKKQNEKNI